MDSKIPDKQIGSYKICSRMEIGRGAQSIVVLGYDKNNTEIAVKIIDKSQLKQYSEEFKQKVQLNIQREIKIQQSLHHHENILRCLDYGETSNSIYLFLEKADQTLLQLMKDFPLDESKLKGIFRQIILGFQFMLHYENQFNYKGVVHLDFKPANVLIKDNIVKISDFGLATPIIDRVESGLFNFTIGQGTPQYMSPEQLKGEPIEDPQKHDIWSAGVVLYEIIYQKHPYIISGQKSPMTPITVNKLISNTCIQFHKNTYYSKEVINLMTHMLDLDYKTRYSWEQCLNHIWFDTN